MSVSIAHTSLKFNMKMKFVHVWRKIHFLASDCVQQVHTIRKECGINI